MKSERFVFRTATLDDLHKVVRMRISLQKHMSERNPNLWQMSEKKVSDLPTFYRTAIDDPQSLLLVVQDEESSKVIGMGLGRICTHDEYNPDRSGRIDDVWIEPSFRRRGLCSSIVFRLIEFFRENNVESLVLDYSDGNTEAEAIWHLLGFKTVIRTAITNVSDLRLKKEKT